MAESSKLPLNVLIRIEVEKKNHTEHTKMTQGFFFLKVNDFPKENNYL